MAKLASNLDLNSIRLPKKIPPIEKSMIRKIKKIDFEESLVATVKKLDVPNHVLNTNIYARLQSNKVFEVSPVEVHFAGFKVEVEETFNGKNRYRSHVQKLRIINISSEMQNMTVIPPQTEFFEIFYVKPKRLVPGFALEIQVIFKPNEYRYYSDSIKIFSEGDENLLVPLHAYPIVSSYDFPSKFTFPQLQVGKSLTKSFSLRSTAPVQFEYVIEITSGNPAFLVEPLEGVINSNQDTFINVTFSPIEFCTASLSMQMIISQFNFKPIVCTFFGSSLPGLTSNLLNNKFLANTSIGESSFDPRFFSPLSLMRNDKRLKQQANKSNTKKAYRNQDEDIDVALKEAPFVDADGYRFPRHLDNPWAISRVLLQKKNKLSMKELRSSAKTSTAISAQVKEALFVQKVTELEDEERRNQLKWQVKLGESLVNMNTRKDIIHSRAKADYEYRVSVGVPFVAQESKRVKSVTLECRPVRDFGKIRLNNCAFDAFKNRVWQLRFLSLGRFVQAVRKVVLKRRLERVLSLLRRFCEVWNEALCDSSESEDIKLNIDNYIEVYAKKLAGESLGQHEVIKMLSNKSLGTHYYPYVADFKHFHSLKARHYEKLSSISRLESLDMVAVRPVDLQVCHQVPFANLAIQVAYQLNCYGKDNCKNVFVPKHDTRFNALRQGAEDELTKIDVGLVQLVLSEPEVAVKEDATKIIDLKPAPELAEPIEYSPMHIFNPAPSLISYQKMLSYSGVDLNYHLNPLPQFEREQAFTTQKRFLDREDVIKGIMSWKKFPSQGLISLSNTPTLTDVWVPRWSGMIFSNDLLPIETPTLLAGLPAEDKHNMLDESDDTHSLNQEAAVYLTPEISNAQFNIPEIFQNRERILKEDALRQYNKRNLFYRSEEAFFPNGEKLPLTNLPVGGFGQVTRDQRQQELEYYLNKQYNSIGIRLQTKLNSIEKQFMIQDEAETNLSTPGISQQMIKN